MGEHTAIAWTDHSFNPWRGCAKVSQGCAHCYAETQALRNPAVLGVWGDAGTRVVASEAMWREPLRWNAAAERDGVRRKVFVASMADVFEDRPELAEPRARLWKLIEATPRLDWLLLTKRPENADRLAAGAVVDGFDGAESVELRWPSNIWLGTTVEAQRAADERIPHMLRAPSRVRFLSVEPLLEDVNLRRWLRRGGACECNPDDPIGARCETRMAGYPSEERWIRCNLGTRRLDWVIVGGESGPRARPFDLAWARSIVAQCREAGVACFVKQMGDVARPQFATDGPTVRVRADVQGNITSRLRLHARAGADPAEWPEDLRVREFPRDAGGGR